MGKRVMFVNITGLSMVKKSQPASALHERLKAARTRAKLTQLALSEAVGISRPTIALWESSKDEIRTRPDAEQVMAYAQACGISPAVLLDDTVSVTEIELLPAGQLTLPGREAHLVRRSPGQTPRSTLFWSTVKLHVTEANPALMTAFDVLVGEPPLTTTVPFLHRRRMVWLQELAGRSRADFIADVLPGVLYAEALFGKRCDKAILVLADAGSGATDGQVIADGTFGCEVIMVRTYETAAARLLQQ